MRNNEIRNEGTDRLVPLSQSKDFKVAKDNPDILGWRVLGANGNSIGMVKDLIVDLQAMKVRYLSVLADRRYFNTDQDQYMIIPIGAAALDKKGRKVFVSHLDENSVARFPVYAGGPITDEYEYSVREAFLQSHNQSLAGNTNLNSADNNQSVADNTNLQQPVASRRISNDFYDHENYNESQFYSSNRQEAQPDNSNLNRVSDNTDYVQRPVTEAYNQNTSPQTVEDAIATIERLEQLRERGSITDEEFRVLKKRALDI